MQSLLRGAGSHELDAIVVELSGVAEPARVKQLLEAPAKSTWERFTSRQDLDDL